MDTLLEIFDVLMLIMIVAIAIDAAFLALDAFYQHRRLMMFVHMINEKNKELGHFK